MNAKKLNILNFFLPAMTPDVVRQRIQRLVKEARTEDEIYRRALLDRELVGAIVTRATTDVLMEIAHENGLGLVNKETGEFIPVGVS